MRLSRSSNLAGVGYHECASSQSTTATTSRGASFVRCASSRTLRDRRTPACEGRQQSRAGPSRVTCCLGSSGTGALGSAHVSDPQHLLRDPGAVSAHPNLTDRQRLWPNRGHRSCSYALFHVKTSDLIPGFGIRTSRANPHERERFRCCANHVQDRAERTMSVRRDEFLTQIAATSEPRVIPRRASLP